jgi:type II restriction/modification system DNA methylase subunit YeeA
VSAKIQAIKELFELAKELIYPPAQGQESAEEKKIKAATAAVKDIAEVVLRLQAAEASVTAINQALDKIDKEIGKLKAMAAIAIALALAAALIAALLK